MATHANHSQVSCLFMTLCYNCYEVVCFTRFPMINAGAPDTAKQKTNLLTTVISVFLSVVFLLVCLKIGGVSNMVFSSFINFATHILICVGGRVKHITNHHCDL